VGTALPVDEGYASRMRREIASVHLRPRLTVAGTGGTAELPTKQLAPKVAYGSPEPGRSFVSCAATSSTRARRLSIAATARRSISGVVSR
jgi:hypothetical protein